MDRFRFAGYLHRCVACRVSLLLNLTVLIYPGHARADIARLSREQFIALVNWVEAQYEIATPAQLAVLNEITAIHRAKQDHALKRQELAESNEDFAKWQAASMGVADVTATA